MAGVGGARRGIIVADIEATGIESAADRGSAGEGAARSGVGCGANGDAGEEAACGNAADASVASAVERKARRFRGKASDGADRTMRVQRTQLGKIGVGAQLRAERHDGWTPECRKAFMEALAATCNVSEAARIVGKNVSGAYHHKRRDPGFAREWAQAIAIGYSELETLLLRQSLFGTEEEEVTLDGDGMVKSRKVKRGHPHSVGFRLLAAHKREALGAPVREPDGAPDGEGAVQRLRLALEVVRSKSGDGN